MAREQVAPRAARHAGFRQHLVECLRIGREVRARVGIDGRLRLAREHAVGETALHGHLAAHPRLGLHPSRDFRDGPLRASRVGVGHGLIDLLKNCRRRLHLVGRAEEQPPALMDHDLGIVRDLDRVAGHSDHGRGPMRRRPSTWTFTAAVCRRSRL